MFALQNNSPCPEININIRVPKGCQWPGEWCLSDHPYQWPGGACCAHLMPRMCFNALFPSVSLQLSRAGVA